MMFLKHYAPTTVIIVKLKKNVEGGEGGTGHSKNIVKSAKTWEGGGGIVKLKTSGPMVL